MISAEGMIEEEFETDDLYPTINIAVIVNIKVIFMGSLLFYKPQLRRIKSHSKNNEISERC